MTPLIELVEKISSKTGFNDQEISIQAGKNPGYIAQLKSRGHSPEKFILILKEKFKHVLNEMPADGVLTPESSGLGFEPLREHKAESLTR